MDGAAAPVDFDRSSAKRWSETHPARLRSPRYGRNRSGRNRGDRRERARAALLMAAAFAVWGATMWLDWLLADRTPLQLVPWVGAGGLLGGAIGAIRTLPDRLPKDPTWVLFRLVSAFAAAGAWIFVLHLLWRGVEIDEHWLNFLLGYIIYGIVRDLFGTFLIYALAKVEARRQEAVREAQRARILRRLPGGGATKTNT